MIPRRLLPHRALLFAGPRDGEEALIEVGDDQWPERIPDDCGYYRLDEEAGVRRRPRSGQVYRWVPPASDPTPSDGAEGRAG